MMLRAMTIWLLSVISIAFLAGSAELNGDYDEITDIAFLAEDQHEQNFGVVINEIHYDPDVKTELIEFIELKNVGAETVDLDLVSFTDGIDFSFDNLEILTGEYVVIVRDHDAFELRYGSVVNIAGEYAGRLNNGGERIRLEDAIGRVILDFSYEDDWYDVTDGDGFSLTIIDPTNPDPNSWGRKDSWYASKYAGGSPGTDDSDIIP